MGIKTFVIGKDTADEEVTSVMKEFTGLPGKGKNVAFVIRKGALSYDGTVNYKNNYTLSREEVIRHIGNVSGEDPIISTTGKASRELCHAQLVVSLLIG